MVHAADRHSSSEAGAYRLSANVGVLSVAVPVVFARVMTASSCRALFIVSKAQLILRTDV